MEVSLAYEMGLLRRPDLNRVQYFALAYYIVSKRREESERDSRTTMDFMSFTNPQLYQAINTVEDDEETMDMSVTPDFGEFEDMIARMERGVPMVETIYQGEEDGWL